MRYTPPTTADLAALKARLSRTGDQMADLFGLAGSRQRRKYTGWQSPREMFAQMAFFAAARLALPPDELSRTCANSAPACDRGCSRPEFLELMQGHEGRPRCSRGELSAPKAAIVDGIRSSILRSINQK
jgi:hypothetical protein